MEIPCVPPQMGDVHKKEGKNIFLPREEENLLMLEEYDAFFSFAEEDSLFAEELYSALLKHNLTIWFSKVHLRVGDSILGAINTAINRSKYGIVLLSKHTFSNKKHFPIHELRGILNKAMYANMEVLPIYLGIDHQYVIEREILISDYLAITATENMTEVAAKIAERIKE